MENIGATENFLFTLLIAIIFIVTLFAGLDHGYNRHKVTTCCKYGPSNPKLMCNHAVPSVAINPNETFYFTKKNNLLIFDIDQVVVHTRMSLNLEPTHWATKLELFEHNNSITSLTINLTETQSTVKIVPIQMSSSNEYVKSLFKIEKINAPSNHTITNVTADEDQFYIFAKKIPKVQIVDTHQQIQKVVSNHTALTIVQKSFFSVLQSRKTDSNVVLYTKGATDYAKRVYYGLKLISESVLGNSFCVDAVVSASSEKRATTAKNLKFFEVLPKFRENFGSLSEYESIVILDDQADWVWCNQKIVDLHNTHGVPFYLIEVPPFDPFFEPEYLEYSFFQTFSAWIDNYMNQTRIEKYRLTRQEVQQLNYDDTIAIHWVELE